MNVKMIGMAALTLALAACSNDEMPDPLANGPVAMTFTADISAVATRAQATAFDTEDPIGIFPITGGKVEAGQANKLYKYGSGKFTSDDPYYFQNTDKVTFNAYYPYKEGLTADAHSIEIITRTPMQNSIQIDGTNISWRKNDYLFAKATTDVHTPSVSYTGESNAFRHVMSQVTFVFKAGTDAGISDLRFLSNYIITELAVNGTFDPVTGIAAPNDDPKEPLNMPVQGNPDVTEIAATPLILLPQTFDGNIFTLEVKYDGQTYKASLTIPEEGWQAGYSYTYNVTIKNTGLEVTEAAISDWKTPTEGGTTDGDATLQ